MKAPVRAEPRPGHSKDHRPDLKQVVLAVVIDGRGRPICSELWPGNTTGVTTLLPVIERFKIRFLIARIGVDAPPRRPGSINSTCVRIANLNHYFIPT